MSTPIILILLCAVLLFTIGAKASIENERGQINWLLQRGIPKAAIIVMFFLLAPWVVVNGFRWCVWRVRVWLALRKVKRLTRRVFERIAANHKDNSELKEDLKGMIDKINNV